MYDYERLVPAEKAATTIGDRLTAKRQIRQVKKALVGIPRDEMFDTRTTCDDVDICIRSRRVGRVVYMFLEDGVSLLYTTRGFLEDRSNRFIFPDDGEPSYHREPFNVDCQALGSQRINVDGIDALVANRNITRQIGFLSRTVKHDEALGWTEFEKMLVPVSPC